MKSDSIAQNKRPPPLPAAKWAVVFRALKPFLRPCGDSGEGRLDFYHRAMSKAVRKKLVPHLHMTYSMIIFVTFHYMVV